MDYISRISHSYKGNILLHPPYKGERAENIPEEIYSLLQVSNGITETMQHPKTGEQIAITWILYPYERIVEETDFYKNEYGIEGVIFTGDGAGSSIVLKPDGKVTCYDVLDDEETQIADSLADFYK